MGGQRTEGGAEWGSQKARSESGATKGVVGWRAVLGEEPDLRLWVGRTGLKERTKRVVSRDSEPNVGGAPPGESASCVVR